MLTIVLCCWTLLLPYQCASSAYPSLYPQDQVMDFWLKREAEEERNLSLQERNSRCQCKQNGVCKENAEGEMQCLCDPGYGVYKHLHGALRGSLTCRECDCGRMNQTKGSGRKFSCKFTERRIKQCICDAPGYYGRSWSCAECNCGQRYDGVLFNCTVNGCNCGVGYKQEKGKCIADDICKLQPCMNGATCTSIADGDHFKCNCQAGFRGKICDELEINPCDSKPCLNGGICETFDTTHFKCNCLPQFTGLKCNLKTEIPTSIVATTEEERFSLEDGSGDSGKQSSTIFKFWKVELEKHEYEKKVYRNEPNPELEEFFKFKRENIEFSNLSIKHNER